MQNTNRPLIRCNRGLFIRGRLRDCIHNLNCKLKRVLWKSLQPIYFWGNLDVSASILLDATLGNDIRCAMRGGALWCEVSSCFFFPTSVFKWIGRDCLSVIPWIWKTSVQVRHMITKLTAAGSRNHWHLGRSNHRIESRLYRRFPSRFRIEEDARWQSGPNSSPSEWSLPENHWVPHLCSQLLQSCHFLQTPWHLESHLANILWQASPSGNLCQIHDARCFPPIEHEITDAKFLVSSSQVIVIMYHGVVPTRDPCAHDLGLFSSIIASSSTVQNGDLVEFSCNPLVN